MGVKSPEQKKLIGGKMEKVSLETLIDNSMS
jgi:hypothetical protein